MAEMENETNIVVRDRTNIFSSVRKCTFDATMPTKDTALGSVFVLDNVLLPLLRYDISAKKIRESNLRSSLHLTYAKKFASRVCRFVDQEEKGVRLAAPSPDDIGALVSATDSTDNCKVHASQVPIKKIERVVSEWNIIITRSIEIELQQNPKNCLPMGEVDFWRRRHVVLSDVMEQIKGENIQKILGVLQAAGSSLSPKIQESISIMMKLGIEAADNAKFLSTLERHLRTLNDGSLSSMATAIPSLVDGMRMVWTVSRHYNRDERTLPLMERVGYHIAFRVKGFIKPQDILQCHDLKEIEDKVQQSKVLLESWRTSYMDTRERIEEMGTSQRRWEFDRVLLFEKTDYMAQICVNLLEVINSVNDFKHFFSPDLLAITGKNDDVNNVVSRVNSLTNVVAVSHFDIFDVRNKGEWYKVMQNFQESVACIEKNAESSIERAFQQLRSSETAYELVVKLKGLKSRQSIHRLVEARYKDILDRYEMELEKATAFFASSSESPPLCWRYQKTPGAIAWAHNMYLRTKRAVVLFQKHGNILSTPRGEKVKKKYLKFAKEVDLFKIRSCDEWCTRIKDICQRGLRRPLLIRSNDIGNRTCIDSSVGSSKENWLPITDITKSKHYLVSFNQVATNFSNEVRIAIAEAKQFDAFGYKIPESLTHLALQQHIYERYVLASLCIKLCLFRFLLIFHCHFRYVIELEKLAKLHNFMYTTMTQIELTMLEKQAGEMERILKPGFTSLNWSSQGVWGFITMGNNAIDTFKSSLVEARKHSTSMEYLLRDIRHVSLVEPDIPVENVSLGAHVEAIEKRANEKSDRIINNYKNFGPLILKVEMVVSHTNIGSSALLKSYYAYWEKKLYNAFVELLLRSFLSVFFVLEVHFRNPRQCIPNSHPKSKDTQMQMKRSFRSLIGSMNKLTRWKYEACKEATSINEDRNKKEIYSFMEDVSRDPSIYSVITGLQNECKSLYKT